MADRKVVAYVSYSPVFGRRPGWLYDLTRRRPDAPPGVIEHVFFEAGQRLAGDGAEWMHLGLTPFVGLEAGHEIEDAHSRPLGRGVNVFEGKLTYEAVAQAHGLDYSPLDEVLPLEAV